jgi:hypothetical protein
MILQKHIWDAAVFFFKFVISNYYIKLSICYNKLLIFNNGKKNKPKNKNKKNTPQTNKTNKNQVLPKINKNCYM